MSGDARAELLVAELAKTEQVPAVARAEPRPTTALGNQAAQAVGRSSRAAAGRPPFPQRKMTVSKPDDPSERDADRAADAVLSEREPDRAPVARRAESTGSRPPPGALHAKASTSGGESLTQPVRDYFEPPFRRDFGDVRVHTGAAAAEAAQSVHARAFTVGNDVVFGAGAFQPNDVEGRRLLAHELAHVVQQDQTPGEASTIQRYADSATPSSLIERYISWGNLDEDALGQKLFELAWMSPDHYRFVISVIDELSASDDDDDVALAFSTASRDDNLDEFASSEDGRLMLKRLDTALMEGLTRPPERGQIYRIRNALAHWDAAQKGEQQGLAILEKAAAKTTPAQVPHGVEVLTLDDLSNRLRLVEAVLDRVAKRYEKNLIVRAFVLGGRMNLMQARANLSVDKAPELSRLVPAAQLILERCENALLNLDLQIAAYRADGSLGSSRDAMIALTENVRARYLEVLGYVPKEEAITAFNRAENVAEQLPRALLELDLTRLEGRPATEFLLEPSRKAIAEWVGRLRTDLTSLEADAAVIAKAREESAPDLTDRTARFERKRELVALSLEAISHWERSLRAHEFLVGEGSIHWGGYSDTSTLRQKCFAMQAAAYANDVEKLRALIKAFNDDPEIEKFYKKLPGIVMASRMIVSLGVTLVAAVATAGVGGMFTSAIGTATTTTGKLLAFAGTVAIETITFTAVSRGLSSVAPGLGAPQGSVLGELAWNCGLFSLMRLASGGARTALAARGLEVLDKPVGLAVSGTLLQSYGVLRFRFEEGRWPTADELGKMTGENLMMMLGITLATRSVGKLIEAQEHLDNLKTFAHKYAWRFEALELGRGALLGKFRTALESGKAVDAATLADLKKAGEIVDAALRTLVEEIKSDSSFSIEGARKEMVSLGMPKLEGSEELLSKSLDIPEEVRLRRAGGLDEYTYEWSGTGRLEERLRAMGATVVKTSNPVSGLRTLTANFPDRPTMTFVERPSPFPASVEVDVSPTAPELLKLLTDYSITDPAAQRFVVRLLGAELSKNPAHGLESAAKLVRKLLRRLDAESKRTGRTAEQELLDLRAKGVMEQEAKPTVVTMADKLAAENILKSTEWLSARTQQEFESAVSEWVAYTETVANTPAGRIVLRRVHIIGDLYQDAALTKPRLQSGTGKARTGVDVVPELDLLTVTQAAGKYEVHRLGNVKGFASGAGDAARQNTLALEALRAHEQGKGVEIKTREGDTAYAKVTKVVAEAAGGVEVDLTGKLSESAGGATTETIGPAMKKSAYDRSLSVSASEIAAITRVLRERQAKSSPDY